VRKKTFLLASLLAATTADADGVCEQGFRETTAEERATVVRVLEAVKATLPAAPAGWIVGGYEQVGAPESICRDGESVPWSYAVSRTYNRTDNLAERDAALAEQGAALRAEMAARQPALDAAMARMQALGAELGNAAQSGDQAKIDALNAELEKLQKELEQTLNEGDTEAQVAAVARTMRDVEMSIAVRVNPGAVSREGREPMPAPAGSQEAFRWQTTTDELATAHALVVVKGERANAPPADARTIAFDVTADPARIDALVGGIDFAAAAKLVR